MSVAWGCLCRYYQSVKGSDNFSQALLLVPTMIPHDIFALVDSRWERAGALGAIEPTWSLPDEASEGTSTGGGGLRGFQYGDIFTIARCLLQEALRVSSDDVDHEDGDDLRVKSCSTICLPRLACTLLRFSAAIPVGPLVVEKESSLLLVRTQQIVFRRSRITSVRTSAQFSALMPKLADTVSNASFREPSS